MLSKTPTRSISLGYDDKIFSYHLERNEESLFSCRDLAKLFSLSYLYPPYPSSPFPWLFFAYLSLSLPSVSIWLKYIKPREESSYRTTPLSKNGGYLLSHKRSTIGAVGLNFSVRNGKRWNPDTITTWMLLYNIQTNKTNHRCLTHQYTHHNEKVSGN